MAATSILTLILRAQDEASRVLAQASGNVTKFGGNLKQMGAAMTQVGTSMMMVGAVGAAALGFAVKAAMDFEAAMKGVEKTVEGTPEQFARLETEIRGMAKETGIAHGELARIAQLGGQLGVPIEKLSKFTEVVAKFAIAAEGMGVEEASMVMARFAAITGMALDDVDRLSSTVVNLGNTMATTEGEIFNMGLRLAAVGSLIGMTEAQILGWAAAMSELGLQAEAGGTAFSRVMVMIAESVAEATLGSTGLEEEIDALNSQLDEETGQLKNIGKALSVAQREYSAATDRVSELKDQLSEATQHLKDLARPELVGMKAAQEGLVQARGRVSELNEQLQEAKMRLKDLTAPKLEGMDAMDDQLFAVQQQAKQARLALLGMTPDSDQYKAAQEALNGLNKQIETLQLQKELKFDAQLRELEKAAEPVGKALTFEEALKGIKDTKGEIGRLEGQIGEADRTLAAATATEEGFQRQMKLIEEAALGVKEALTFEEVMKSIAGTKGVIADLTPRVRDAERSTKDWADTLEGLKLAQESQRDVISLLKDDLVKLTKAQEDATKPLEDGRAKMALFAKTAGMSADEFAAAWGRDPSEAMQTFLAGLGQLEAPEKFKVLKMLGMDDIRLRDTMLRLAGAQDTVTKGLLNAVEGWVENSAAEEEYQRKMESARSELGKTWAAINDLAITLGNKLLPIIKDVLKWVTDFISGLGENEKTILLWGAAILAGIAALGLILASIGMVVSALAVLGPAIGIVVSALGLILTPIGAIVAAVALLAVAWTQNWGDIQGKVEAVVKFVGDLIGGFIDFLGDQWGIVMEGLGVLVRFFQEAWDRMMWVVRLAVQFFGEEWDRMMRVAGVAWEFIDTRVLRPLGDAFTAFKDLLARFFQFWQEKWERAVAFVQGIADRIGQILQPLRDIIDGIGNALGGLGDWIGGGGPAAPPPQIPDFQHGGVVPGPWGAPRLVIAHGGEPIGMQGQSGGGGIVINGPLVANAVIREEADIRKLAKALGEEIGRQALARSHGWR